MLAVQDLIIDTGYPIAMIDQPAFRELVSVLDPKFKMCGKCPNELIVRPCYLSIRLLLSL
jgi:hypothetical protein